jgi:hypothetical protein
MQIEEEKTIKEEFLVNFPEKKIVLTPMNNRVIVALGRYSASSSLIVPGERLNTTDLLNIGKILAVGPDVKSVCVGDWVEVPRNLILPQSCGVNDLRIKNDILKYHLCWMGLQQIVQKVEFPEGGEPGLLLKDELDKETRKRYGYHF